MFLCLLSRFWVSKVVQKIYSRLGLKIMELETFANNQFTNNNFFSVLITFSKKKKKLITYIELNYIELRKF